MKQLPLFALLVLLAAPALGQTQTFEAARVTEAHTSDGPQVLHISDWLAQQPAAKAALAAFHAAKAAGWQPPVPKRTAAVGDTMAFDVVNVAESRLETRNFKLMVEGERYLLWVELAQLNNGNVTQETIDAVAAAMGEATPPGSINPSAGVIVNDEAIFGAPPNVDGDGKSDVLLVDVRDNYNPDAGRQLFIAGFVTPADLPGGPGNNADVLYLDTDPSLDLFGVDFMAQTAAHEYQHLIHFNYDRDEITFVNEGLSEWAEVVNGYPGRNLDYLGNDKRYNVPLFRFSDTGSLDDRQRSFRMINYIADVLGVETAGKITRQSDHGSAGIQDALGAGKRLSDLLVDFHLANLLNDTEIDARYGFTTPHHLDIRTVPVTAFDGRIDPEMPLLTTEVRAGAALFFEWTNVEDLAATLTPGGGNVVLRAITLREGTTDVRVINPGMTDFPGVYDRVVVAAIHTDPDAVSTSLEASATWNTENQFIAEDVFYDDGIVPRTSDNILLAFRLCSAQDPALCRSTRFANVFAVPDGAMLSRVSIAPFFDHDFTGQSSSDDDPRDLALKLWAADGDIIGTSTRRRPGTELFSIEVTDSRASSFASGDRVVYLDIDLSAHADELSQLPDSVYIGFENTGSDINFLVMGVVGLDTGVTINTTAENAVSFLHRSDFGAWAAFHELQSGGESILERRAHPIRARFLTPIGPTADEDTPEVPTTITLAQNYPNPFNPSTTIAYTLPQPGPVRLAVFDVLGREVAVLFDGTQVPGTHHVQVDARTWTSGMYFYVLDAGGQRQARRMLLVK